MRLKFLVTAVLYAVIVFAAAEGGAHVSAQTPPPIDIFVEEGIGVGDDDPGADPQTAVGADDDVTVSDDAAVTPPTVIDVDDGVSVTDDPGVFGPATLNVDDGISVSDDPGVVGPATVNVDDGVSVIDGPTVTPPASIVVTEGVLVEDDGGPVGSTPIVDAGLSMTVFEGQPVTLRASVITLNPELATAVIVWDDGDSDRVVPSAAGEITAVHLYEGDGSFTVSVIVAGPFGDSGDDTVQATVLNHVPFVNLGGPYGGASGAGIVLVAEGSDPGDDPLTYIWDLDEDGQFGDATGQTTIFSSATPGLFQISVRATDDAGLSGTDTADVTVSVAPVVPTSDPNLPA
ncbi:MAG: PKD domain-containing protein, partial [Chloroflexi bacterium]|nr:PKD domain-containing protein [Chloroflexota bacterium]